MISIYITYLFFGRCRLRADVKYYLHLRVRQLSKAVIAVDRELHSQAIYTATCGTAN